MQKASSAGFSKNLLISSVGRRCELVEIFKRAFHKRGWKVFGADASKTAPALYFCDEKFQIPRISDKEAYLESLIKICRRNNIGILVPTIDTELDILAENSARFLKDAGTFVLVSSPEVVKLCRDKALTQKFFEENSIPVPQQIPLDANPDNLDYPLIIKPRFGSSSINTFDVNNKREFLFFKDYIRDPIIQQKIIGTEFTIDAFCDFDANPITVVARERIAVRSGEVLKGRIVRDEKITELSLKILRLLKAIGHITLQCIKNSEGIFFIEINPRFGGGAPMSMLSGADSAENIALLLEGKKLKYSENYTNNLTFLRFDSSIALNENFERVDLDD